jgi:glycosyltransferase involved in cell wall biosynthesis
VATQLTSSPLVSVLTPSYNQGRWLGDNLHSVGSQNYDNLEHIVMDGRSTDNSLALLERGHPRLRWRSEPDRGQSHALNKAFAESAGEIIGWLNSDDAYFEDDVISSVVEYFKARPDISVVYGHAALVNSEGLILQTIWVPPFHVRLLRLHNFIIQPATFVRRSALDDWLVDERYDYAMDAELWLRLSRRHGFARINKVTAIDRHHLERKSLGRQDLAAVDNVRLCQEHRIRNSRAARVPLKLVKIAFRVAGLALIPRVVTAPLVFDGSADSGQRLAIRQVAVRRSRMQAGNST